MIYIKLLGRFADPMPKKYKRQRLKLHTNKLSEVVALLDQYYDFSGELRTYIPEIRIGTTLANSKQLINPAFATAHIPDGSTIYIVPRPQGSGPAIGAALVDALIAAAVSIAVQILTSLLFPPPQTTNDKRKSVLYSGGLNTQKEGVALPYIAGRRVLCGGNVIEADVDITNTGGASTKRTFLGIPYDTPDKLNDGTWWTGTDGYNDLRDTVQGSKGGGNTIPNNIFSNASLRILLATGMGEIEGIVGNTVEEKEQNIYFNEVPARDHGTGQLQFNGLVWEERNGVLGQSPIPITPGIPSVQNRSIDLKQSTGPITETVTAPNVNRIKVLFNVNALINTDKKGNQHETDITLGVNVKRESQLIWQNAGIFTVVRKSSDRFQLQFPIPAPAGDPEDRWQFQVYRLTGDSTDDKLTNDTSFAGWSEIIDEEYAYDGSGAAPATALYGCGIDLAQFNNGSEPPEIALLLSGTKVRVPLNYDPVARTYATTGPGTAGGMWDGQWKYASTDNPVWHWLNIATDPQLCAFPDSYFNKGTLLQTAKYCDELVNGRHRFSLNKQFTDETGAWEFLVELASSFRAWCYFNGSEIILVQDRTQNQPTHYVNNSMVENGDFRYSMTPIEERFNEIRVEYDNPDDFYRKATVVYRDELSITENVNKGLSSNGVISQTYYKVGCTDAQEAYDFARLLCFIHQKEIEILEFDTLIAAAAYAPGQIIEVDDWSVTGKQPHGRIADVVDSTHIKLDQPFTLEAGKSYTAHLVVNNQLVIRPVAIQSVDVTTDIIPVSSDMCEFGTPVGIVESGGVQPRQFRIVDIKDAGYGKFTVTARQHVEGKYEWAEEDIPVPVTQWTKMKLQLPPPTGLRASAHSWQDSLLGPQHSIEIAWDAYTDQSFKVKGYRVEVQEPGSSQWTDVYEGPNTVVTLKGAAEGNYVISVKAINILNQGSDAASISFSFNYGEVDTVYPPVFRGFV